MGIPAVLVHGPRDLSCPVDTAWQLAQAWPGAELHTPADASHKNSESKRAILQEAMGRFATGG